MKRALIILTFLTLFFLTFNGQNSWLQVKGVSQVLPEVNIIEETSDYIILKFNINSYKFEEVTTPRGQEFIIRSPKCSNSIEKGFPNLAFYSTSIQIPNKGRVQTEVISSDFSVIPSILIAPSKGNIKRNQNYDSLPYIYGDAYNIKEFLPTYLSRANEPFILSQIRGSVINIYPFSYNAVSTELRIYHEIVVKVSFNITGDAVNEIHNTSKFISEDFSHIYKKIFINYNQKSQLKYTPLQEGTPGRMLIICKDDYSSAMTDFVSWKREKGVETELVLTSVTGTTSSAVKTYIQNYYNTHNNLSYILLVGDGNDIVPINVNGSEETYYSDNHFALLAGNDRYVDAFIGRFSGNSLADIQTQVSRTIKYERDLTTSETWLEQAFGSASSEGSGQGHNGGETDLAHMDLIKNKLTNYGYRVTSVNEVGGSNAQITSAFNNGVGIANYIGHGDVTEWSSTSFNNSEVNALNNINKLPFIISVACVNGQFVNNTCFAEAWLRAKKSGEPTGALAFLGSTILQPWAPPMTGQDEMIDILIESYNNNIKRTFGGISFNGIFKMIEAEGDMGIETADTWTIFGDPSVVVRTKTPSEMVITHENSIVIGTNSFIVNCNTNGALACISGTSENGTIIYGYAYVNNGQANIPLNNINVLGTLKLTITAYNKVSYQQNIHVISPTGPYVSLLTHTLNDTNTGNSNQQADYNETLAIGISLKNYGVSTAENVRATITTTNQQITENNDVATFGNINSDEIKTIDNAFNITIANGIIDQSVINFNLNIQEDNNQWTNNFNIIVNAPAFELSIINIDDSENGNNNGLIEPGETIKLRLTVKNIGHANSENGSLSININNPNITITETSLPVNVLLPNAEQNIEFTFTANSSIELGSNCHIEFNLISGAYSKAISTNLPIGAQIEDWETNTFTKYSWDNNDNIPWQIVNTNAYQGQYCAKSGRINNNAKSSLIIIIDCLKNDSISFYKKVSCQASYWGLETDFLAFYIDNTLKAKWNGEVAWSVNKYDILAGRHEFKWSYEKDGYMASGGDCAWLDNIKLPAHANRVTIINNNRQIEDNKIGIYPNPVDNLLNISLDLTKDSSIKIKIYNILGQVVYQTNNNINIPQGNNEVKINAESLVNGQYIIELNIDNTIHTLKFIKGL